MRGLRTIALQCACALALALVTAWVSLSLTRVHTADSIYNMGALFDGRALRFETTFQHDGAFYNTQIVAGLNTLLSRTLTFVSPGLWYAAIRIATFAVAFGVFLIGIRAALGIAAKDVLPAAMLLALATITTFNHPWEHPTDALDIASQLAGALLAIRGRWALVLLIGVIFAANKEYAAYLGLTWLVLAPPSPLPRRVTEGAIISIASVLCVVGLRYFIGHAEDSGYRLLILENLAAVSSAIVHFQPGSWMTISAAVVLVSIALLDLSNPFVVRLTRLAALLALPAFFFEHVVETRTLLPVYTILALAAAVSAKRCNETSDGPTAVGTGSRTSKLAN